MYQLPEGLNQKAEQYLQVMQAMSPDAGQAFRRIYEQAPHGAPHSPAKGNHVRQAMVAALYHPEIAYWARLNLAVRVARKLAQTTGQQAQCAKLEETLEAFHIATDAFVLEINSVMAWQRRQRQQPEPRTQTNAPSQGTLLAQTKLGIPAEEITLIQNFKRQVIPGLIGNIRHGLRRSGSATTPSV